MFEPWGLVDCRIPVRGVAPPYALLPASHDGRFTTTPAGALWSGSVKLSEGFWEGELPLRRRLRSGAKLLELALGEFWLVVGSGKGAALMDPQGQKRAHIEFGLLGAQRILLTRGPELAFVWLGEAQGMSRDYLGAKLYARSGPSGVLLQEAVGVWRVTKPKGLTRFRDRQLEAEVSTNDPPLPIDILALFGSYLLLMSRARVGQIG